jgi:Asp-tRNA(Asn)/Glu-tRNA(Gln) amidotransferase A subunit family amidase
MQNLIFDIYNLSHKDKAIADAKRAFARAGAQVVSVDVDAKTKTTLGIVYREVQFGFADSQIVRFGVNAHGDVAQVRINGKTVPLKNPDDHGAAIKEIVALMEKGRTKFQAALAKVKAPLPATVRTAAPRIEQVWREKVTALDTAIAEATEKRDGLRAQLG